MIGRIVSSQAECMNDCSHIDIMSYRYSSYLVVVSASLISFTLGIALSALLLTKRKRSDLTIDQSTQNSDKSTSLLGIAHPYSQVEYYKGCVYLDYNATTCIFPEVAIAMNPFLTTSFGNPSSNHIYSIPCREAIKIAREHIRQLIKAPNALNIYFTSCGSESDNRAIDVAIHHYLRRSNSQSSAKVITSAIEHPAIINYLTCLRDSGMITLDVLPVNNEGKVDVHALISSLSENTALVTIMHSNNEVGTIQPIKEISKAIKAFNRTNNTEILFHVDAAQSLGKVEVDVQSCGIDMLTIVGHKYGAPKGVAALYIEENVSWCPMLIGGGQERGIRAGTENVAMIVGLGEASRIAFIEADQIFLHMLEMKYQLMQGLEQHLNKISRLVGINNLFIFNGPENCNSAAAVGNTLKMIKAIAHTVSSNGLKDSNIPLADHGNSKLLRSQSGSSQLVDQLPNTISISFRGLKAYELLELLHDKVACSAGSACHSQDTGPNISPVLKAMKIPEEYASGTLRLSLGRHTTSDDIAKAIKHISEAVHSLVTQKQTKHE